MKDMRSTQVRRQERYGIKKLSVGVASVLVATTLYFLPGSAQVLAASQESSPKSCVKICRLSYSLFAFGEVDQEGARIGLPSIV